MTTTIADAAETFRSVFAAPPVVVAAAPGRVNLIGEHTDYNEGFVLPAAISRTVAVAAGPGQEGILHMVSTREGSPVRVGTGDDSLTAAAGWSRYPAAVYKLVVPSPLRSRGVNLAVAADLPARAGLASSAALEVAVCTALSTVLNIPRTPEECALLCREAEHDIVGVRCGIMDQLVAAMAREGHALFLDCRSLATGQIPFPPGLDILICHTGIERDLLSTPYNTRQAECAEAARLLAPRFPGLSTLRDPGVEDLPRILRFLPAQLGRRVRHVVTENCRVRETADALRTGDLDRVGKMLFDSHLSLKNHYEVSCPELDAIVDICASHEGVVGARMTGAGFGGAAIALVHREAAQDLAARLTLEYPRTAGRIPVILRSVPAGGVSLHIP